MTPSFHSSHDQSVTINMGCTLGHQLHRNQRTFRVYNVDKNGVARTMGRIEITEEDLILYQKGKDSICWPLRSLRRYGFDAELFSFESGRRCPTGQGIYAFKCQRAEALFNLLQECIQRAGQEDSGGGRGAVGASVLPADPLPMTRPISQAMEPWPDSPRAQYINSDAMLGAGTDRLEAILNQHHQYVNTATMPHNGHNNSSNGDIIIAPEIPDMSPPSGPNLHYAQLDLPSSTSSNGNGVQISTKDTYAQEDIEASQATYVNVQAGEVKRHRGKPVPPMLELMDYSSVPGVGAAGAGNENGVLQNDVNYIQVDIVSTGDSVPASPAATQVTTTYQFPIPATGTSAAAAAAVAAAAAAEPAPLPPLLEKEREDKYAVIDFDKTYAINAKNADNEGVRKTRHNSNLEDCV